MKPILMLILFVAAIKTTFAQTHTEKINKDYSFAKPGAHTVMIANINGGIQIEGYDGDKVLVEVTKTVNGKTTERLEKGKTEVQLGVEDLADTLIFFVNSGCSDFGFKSNGKIGKRSWHYGNNCGNNRCREEYTYKMDFVVRVPAGVSVNVSTINDGNVSVRHVQGVVIANNINGHIRLEDLTREAEAKTINGNVDIDYTRNPTAHCSFYTLNGDINAMVRKGLAANLGFESFNGEFFTNIDKLETLPPEVEKNTDNEMTKYKIAGNRYRVGTGGVKMDFETFNGNVYLKEKN